MQFVLVMNTSADFCAQRRVITRTVCLEIITMIIIIILITIMIMVLFVEHLSL